MQNKGFVKIFAVLLTLICIFYLSFSFVTRHYENKAAAMGKEEGAAFLDSVMKEKVYLNIYTLKECREMEIGLGLDLKGGMNVILEVSVPDVVKTLAAEGKKAKALEYEITVSGLTELTEYDIFQGLEIRYEGLSGHATGTIRFDYNVNDY